MNSRNMPRNRESKPRSGTPRRPAQTAIDQAKLSNLPSWRKKMLRLADKNAEELARRRELYIKKGWLSPEEAI